jgi:hypothetical protein
MVSLQGEFCEVTHAKCFKQDGQHTLRAHRLSVISSKGAGGKCRFLCLVTQHRTGPVLDGCGIHTERERERQGLTMQPKLASNLRSSQLSLLSAGIIDKHHQAHQTKLFLNLVIDILNLGDSVFKKMTSGFC